MKNETIVKSIIYGNSCTNGYGMFRALCAAISDKEHIDKIVFYLRAAENFRKYNKYVYAFRLEEAKPVFVTETAKGKAQYVEGFNEDTTLEGNGEKLLHLLQKFNVRNVLVIVAIAQKDPLQEFNSEHYRAVVKCAKDLLKSLYDRVLKSDDHNEVTQSEMEQQPIPRKLYVLPQLYQPPKFVRVQRLKDDNRPNYIGSKIQPHGDRKALRRKMDIKYLDVRIKELAYSLENLINEFGERESTIIKFAVQYERSPVAGKIIKALCRLLLTEDKTDLLKEELGSLLKRITSTNIPSQVISELNIMVLGDRELTLAKANGENKVLGMLFEFLTILLKSYSYAKHIAILQAESEELRESGFGNGRSRSLYSRHSEDSNSIDGYPKV